MPPADHVLPDPTDTALGGRHDRNDDGRLPPRPHDAVWPKRLPRSLIVPETSLWFNLEVAATRFPHHASTVFLGRTQTWRELRVQAEAIAGWLRSVGVGAGDRVALYLQNCPQWIAAFYGIVRADAVVVPVNPMNKADEFTHYIVDPQTKVVICAADLAPHVAQANAALEPAQRVGHLLLVRYADALPEGGIPAELTVPQAMADWLNADPPLPQDAQAQCVRWNDALAMQLAPGPHAAGPDDLAVLPYTSGTTANPKGCMHTHRTLMHNAWAGRWTHTGAETVGLGVVPMFHITGMVYGVLAPAVAASTTVVMPRWDRELAGTLISRYRVTHWVCIPTMIIDLFASPNLKRFDLSSLRSLSGGGAAMPKAVAERLESELGISFAEGYGLTETAAPTHTNPPERPKLQCLGIPIFGVDSRVVDPLTLAELPAGEVGEIITRGPMVFKGYWRQPEATAAAFVDFDGRSFFRTGDLGYRDEEGYFFLTDRLKRMINASGYKVWPAEVEALLYRNPAVQEACIIATRDAYRGESVKAVVVLRAEARGKVAESEIIDWAREHMAAYKVPRAVEFVEALPKSGSGKVMWRALQEREGL